VGENRPSIHPGPMPAGPGSFGPMSTMPNHMHSHPTGMSMPMQSTMVDLQGKQTPTHMGVPPVRGPTPDRKIRGSAAATGQTNKRPPRVGRGANRAPAMQAPTATNMYSGQAPQHPMFPQQTYGTWIPSQPMPGSQQPSMMPASQQASMMSAYQNTPQMKQQHVMQNVRPTGVAHVRPGVPYNNQPMQQQPTSQQQQQGQPSQMPVGYMNDQSSMMMSSAGANSIPQNANRPPGVATSGKRKLNETTMYANEQPLYTTSAKMPPQSAGKNFTR